MFMTDKQRSQLCRQRHFRCDDSEDGGDACVRCKKLRIECKRDDYFRFAADSSRSCGSNVADKQEEFSYGEEQVWVKPTTELSWLDETQDLRRQHGHTTDGTLSTPALQNREPKSPVTHAMEGLNNRRSNSRHSNSPSFQQSSSHSPPELGQQPAFSPITPTSGNEQAAHNVTPRRPLRQSVTVQEPYDVLQDWYSPNEAPIHATRYVLQPSSEARLLRHFVTVISPWFDVCDPETHFARIVPVLAQDNEVLRKAIYSVSAWHLSRFPEVPGEFNVRVADHLYHDCLISFRAVLNEPGAAANDALLAAMCILHFLEELREPYLGKNFRGHIMGIRVFLNANTGPQTFRGSVRQAAFRLALRQESLAAFVAQQPLRFTSDCCSIDPSFSEAEDEVWAFRIILHCANLLTFCFSHEARSLMRWRELSTYCDEWMARKPRSFDPIFSGPPRTGPGEYFPIIWYLGSCHVMAAIHYYLCKLLLTVYDPSIPRLGLQKSKAERDVDVCVKEIVNTICGAALSHDAIPSALISATMVITLCGDKFTGENERRALLSVLDKTEELHRWPVEAARAQLS